MTTGTTPQNKNILCGNVSNRSFWGVPRLPSFMLEHISSDSHLDLDLLPLPKILDPPLISVPVTTSNFPFIKMDTPFKSTRPVYAQSMQFKRSKYTSCVLNDDFSTTQQILATNMAKQLREAVENGQNDTTIRWLLEGFLAPGSGDVNVDISPDPDKSDRLLHLAVRHRRLDIVIMLVEEFGANIRIADFNMYMPKGGIVPLQLATMMDFAEIRVYLQIKENIILLREAIEQGNVDGLNGLENGVNQLIPQLGVDSSIAPHIRNYPQNYTALHYAAEKNQPHIVRILHVQHGANILTTNASGQTPLEVAVVSNHDDVVRVFVEEFGQDTTNLAEHYQDRIRQMLQ